MWYKFPGPMKCTSQVIVCIIHPCDFQCLILLYLVREYDEPFMGCYWCNSVIGFCAFYPASATHQRRPQHQLHPLINWSSNSNNWLVALFCSTHKYHIIDEHLSLCAFFKFIFSSKINVWQVPPLIFSIETNIYSQES